MGDEHSSSHPSSPAGPRRAERSETLSVPQGLARATALQQQGRLRAAADLYAAILRAAPEHPQALHNLGVVRATEGDHETALRLIARAVELDPGRSDAHSNLGNVLRALTRNDEALAAYDRALAVDPRNAQAHFNRGTLLRALDRQAEALASFDRALALRANDAPALNGRGNALFSMQRVREALAAYDAALAIAPGYAEAHYNRGNALRALDREEEALAAYDRALAARPDYAEALNNRGNALRALERPSEAVLDYDRALALRPDHVNALNNRGNALREVGRKEEALSAYERAIALRPDYAEAHFNRALALLSLGDFERGWPEYEWRWRSERIGLSPRPLDRPLWLGREEIAGATVLLYAEQGLGDAIQFCRYAELVARRGARVLIEAPAPLAALFESLHGVDRVLVQGDALPAFDFHCPLLSLPLAFGTTLASIPAAVPYLSAPLDRVQSWRRRLADRPRPWVGVVWSGSSAHKGDRGRSIGAARMLPGLAATGVTLVSLQKELRSGDAQGLIDLPAIARLGEALEDFADTAALVSLLDVMITVDTSVAHLAGALARPVWIVLPFGADWRWLLGREDSPWYPTARLFRQHAPGDWESVLAAVARALVSVSGVARGADPERA